MKIEIMKRISIIKQGIIATLIMISAIPSIAQNNCVCVICYRPCNEIATMGHKNGFSCSSSYSSGYSNSNIDYNPQVPDQEYYNTEFTNFLNQEADKENNIGIEFYKKQEWSKAIKHFKKATKYIPGNSTFETNLDYAIKQLELQKEKALNSKEYDSKTRLARSEATKAINQLNCAAFSSLQAAQTALNDLTDFRNLEGSAEKARKLADFSSPNRSECPEIKIEIPEVNANQPESYQALFYNYILHKSDSIKTTIVSLKIEKIKTDKAIEEKKKKVEEVKKVIEKQKQVINPVATSSQDENDQLVRDALKELESATGELQTAEENGQKMQEDISLKEKNITALEKMRSTYDTDKKPAASGQSPKK
jgi:hypothetical protein